MTQRNSVRDRMAKLQPGESTWIEADKNQAVTVMRTVSAVSRRPAHMQEWEFKCRSHVAVEVGTGAVTHLVCITRTT